MLIMAISRTFFKSFKSLSFLGMCTIITFGHSLDDLGFSQTWFRASFKLGLNQWMHWVLLFASGVDWALCIRRIAWTLQLWKGPEQKSLTLQLWHKELQVFVHNFLFVSFTTIICFRVYKDGLFGSEKRFQICTSPWILGWSPNIEGGI